MTDPDGRTRVAVSPAGAPANGGHAPSHPNAPSWRGRTFGPASEEPYRRRTKDWARLVLAVIVLVWAARHADHAGDPEASLFQFFNSLPGGLRSLFRAIDAVGSLWAVGLVVAAALVGRRWRLARDLVLSGVLTWAVARGLATFVDHGSLADSLHAVLRVSRDAPHFPFVRLAVIVAVVCAASPFLTRPTRRLGQLLVLLTMFAAMYLGVAFPNDLLGALALGWGVAAAVHLVFGSPGGRPSAAQVTASLAELGVDARDVHLAPHQPAGTTMMVGRDDGGPLWLKVIGRDEADAQFMAKLWRFLVYKDSGPTLFLTRLQQVEHEAYTALRARDAGVNVPEVVVAATAGPNTALLVERTVVGPRLAEADPASVSDGLLRELWRQVGLLHAARLAHGTLNATHLVLADHGPTLVDFETASVASPPDRRPRDVAELLASTAQMVGEERAVAAARAAIGPEAIAAALPFLQPAALSHQALVGLERSHRERGRKERRARLKRLRHLGAAAAGTDEPALRDLHRVKGSSLVMAVGMFAAAAALLGQVGSPEQLWDTVKNAQWGWLAVAFVLSMATNVAFAIALLGAVPIRMPLLATTELQVSMSFSNLAIPGVGGTAAQVRFVQKQGADLASAVASGGFLATVASTAVQLGLFAVALALSPTRVDIIDVPTSSIVSLVLGAVLLAGVAAAVLFGIPRLRRAVLPPIRQATSTLWSALRSPRQLSLLVAGNLAAALVYGLCLAACLAAFGGSLSYWTLLAVNIGVSTVASLVPVPGGSTAMSSVGVSGALTAFGVPTEVAVSAVLTNQIVVSYLPAVLGWFATTDLLHRDLL